MPRTSSAPIVMTPLTVAIRTRFGTLDAFAAAIGVSPALVSMVLTRQRPLHGVLAERARAAGLTDEELDVTPITDHGQYVRATVAIALAQAARELGVGPEVAEAALGQWERGELDGLAAEVFGRPVGPDQQLAS